MRGVAPAPEGSVRSQRAPFPVRALAEQIAWLLLVLGLALFAGWLLEQYLLALLLAGWGCLAAHLVRLVRLERQLATGVYAPYEGGGGLWAAIYGHIYRRRRRREQRERVLRGTLGKFREAIEAAPDAAVAVDERGLVLWSNRAADTYLGLHMPGDSGRPLADLVRHPEFLRFVQGESGAEGVDFPAPADPSIMLRARLIPYGQGQRLLIAGDITQIHYLEQVRRDFVANVSHELRTPLTVISGYLEAMLESEDPGLERWRKPLRGMRQQADRMLHIIEDLLMLSRLESGDDRPASREVAVPAMLESLAAQARTLASERGHHVELEVDRSLALSGAEKELYSAFSNLITNAVRYTPPGSTVRIRWRDTPYGPLLVVADNGEGIAPQHIPRLTERFYRVDRGRQRESGGTGLGLAIVKHVMQRHQGRLVIESELGKGSTFSCHFPPERALRGAQ